MMEKKNAFAREAVLVGHGLETLRTGEFERISVANGPLKGSRSSRRKKEGSECAIRAKAIPEISNSDDRFAEADRPVVAAGTTRGTLSAQSHREWAVGVLAVIVDSSGEIGGE